MYKLVILIEALDDWQAFEEEWPNFLHQAELMPGLIREATCRVERFLIGSCHYVQIHELFFTTADQVERAMATPQGKEAGKILQRITQGNVTLFIADHKEDDLENIRRHQLPERKKTSNENI